LAHKGKKTNEVLEQEMFSLTNQLIKRSGLSDKELVKFQRDLQIICIEYLQDYESRVFH